MKSVVINFIFIIPNISWCFGLSCNQHANSIYEIKIT